MLRYNGIYVATTQLSVSSAIGLIELQCPSGTIIDILRMWVGPDRNNHDDVTGLEIYKNSTAGTGSSLAENLMRGVRDAGAQGTAIQNLSPGAGRTTLWYDGMHYQNGWEWVASPEDRIRLQGGESYDNVGIYWEDAPATGNASVGFGIMWGELR